MNWGNACFIFFQTHICVEQTAIELLARNLKVHIIADASTSRNQADRLLAIEVCTLRMKNNEINASYA